MSRKNAKKFYELARDNKQVHKTVRSFQEGVVQYAKAVHGLDFTYDELMEFLGQHWGADFEKDNPDPGHAQTCSCFSDRNLKENFTQVDKGEILGRLMSLEVSGWNYKGESQAVRHVGPMAQDFNATFELCQSDRRIDLMDASGVTMAAVQALCELSRKRDAEIRELRREVKHLRQRVGCDS